MVVNKINRVVYRLWHNGSTRGLVGYIGRDRYHPNRWNLVQRRRDRNCRKLYWALRKYPPHLWQKEVLAFGFLSDEGLIAAEELYIKQFDSKEKGYNLTSGGEGILGLKHTAESNEKNRMAHLGRKHNEATKAKMSKSHTGHTTSSETCEKIRLSKIGIKRTPEARENMRKARINWLKNNTVSKETCEKLSAALKKIWAKRKGTWNI